MSGRQVVSSQDMRQLDKLTMQTKNITSYQLMQQAANGLTTYLVDHILDDVSGVFVVVAGLGNNGGDALLMGQQLYERGVKVSIVLVGNKKHQSEDSIQAATICEKQDIPMIRVETTDDLNLAIDMIDSANIILDGLFGIGLTRDIEGIFASIVDTINHSYGTVISIDIPSGIHADNGLMMGCAVHANHTLIVQKYKQGNILNDALDYHGQSHLVDVGIMDRVQEERQELISRSYVYHNFPKRTHNSYKYIYGNVLTIGGSKGMMGAPLLASYTALRTGSGLSHLLYHESYLPHANNIYPDVMMDTYMGIEEIPQLTKRMSAIIFGPGLGRKDDINKDVLSYLLSTNIPLVIDADGIYYLKQLLQEYSERQNIVITPHYKEMADFLGISIDEVIKEPVLYARNIAHTYNLTVVLKGTCTIITNNECTYFSAQGNPGLATAGTGDVLSGIIGSLLGRGLEPLESATLGVLVHSLAAHHAMKEYGEDSMIASDVIAGIPKVIQNAKS